MTCQVNVQEGFVKFEIQLDIIYKFNTMVLLLQYYYNCLIYII